MLLHSCTLNSRDNGNTLGKNEHSAPYYLLRAHTGELAVATLIRKYVRTVLNFVTYDASDNTADIQRGNWLKITLVRNE